MASSLTDTSDDRKDAKMSKYIHDTNQLLDAVMASTNEELQELARQFKQSHKSLLATAQYGPTETETAATTEVKTALRSRAPNPTLTLVFLDQYTQDSPPDDISSPAPATETVVPTQPLAPGAFFRLPAEIRSMVYKLLLPKPKIIRASARYRTAKRSNGPKRWEFHTGDDLKAVQPQLSHICAESRAFLMQHGSYIFKKDKNEGGIWWNSKHDVLVFERWWWECDHYAYALENLQGLEHVHHVGLDPKNARSLGYQVHYARGPGMTRFADLPGTQSARDVSRVNLAFYPTFQETLESQVSIAKVGAFPPQLFPCLRSIAVVFVPPYLAGNDSLHKHTARYLRSGPDSVRFELGATEIATVRHQLGRYKQFWFNIDYVEPELDYYEDLVSHIDSVLPYYENLAHTGVAGRKKETVVMAFNSTDLTSSIASRGSFDREHNTDPWDSPAVSNESDDSFRG